MSSKRLILLLDGTWDDQDFGKIDTNVVRLEQNSRQEPDADGT